MGKSPAKWIKTLLLGKKSSKSNLSKGREKLNSTNKGEGLVSSKVTVSDLSGDPPTISAPILVTSARSVVEPQKDTPNILPNDGVNVPSAKEDGNDNAIANLGNLEDPERIRLDQAAAKAQAAFRGYLARRAFRTLKGIIRLQALIRGHLVRRQAVATLCSTWAIVKFQALARGQKVRCSHIGIEVQKKHLVLGSKSSDSFRVSISAQVKNLSSNAFVQKLLASSPSAVPLQLQYGPEEPNSSWQWLQRWTRSHFWDPPTRPVKSLASKSQKKGDANAQGKIKRGVRKVSNAKVENGSNRSTLEHEKSKRGPRRVSGNPADSAREQSQNELEKVKRNLRKLADSAKEASDKSEVNEKPKQTLKKTSSSDAPDVSGQESAEEMRDVTTTLSEPPNVEADLKLSMVDDSPNESNVCPAVDLQLPENNGETENMEVTEELSPKDEQVSNESLKASQRRASFPVKIENQENGVNSTPKLPSYMAPTESAKARLRGQGSPRFTREVVEKNGLNRRYSLPSSTTTNLSPLSPRAQRLVQAAGKGAIRNEKSLSASKDASDKGVRAEWRR
ncbi:IQ motif, EF-hand binding site [Corchorus capsularis]|uniref:IQ motif, EF-hand binding site n=1 Tax=Corchorus capsularis TaxID=210143 RepID=A0A1R3GKV5_COCAP|nr:IQ motif, EF-hand binding site [Corchorus capsularis]